jgi:hypothetical protein
MIADDDASASADGSSTVETSASLPFDRATRLNDENSS